MVKVMTVRELIAILETFEPNLPVAYKLYSEQCLLEPEDLHIAELCHPRPDGWVQNKRPDMPATQYLLLPGN